jgi:hypothetical protein
MINKINNVIIKPIALAGSCSTVFSLCFQYFFPNSPQNSHWIYSICFHAALGIAMGILMILFPKPKTMVSNLLSISLGRLLASAIAFMLYRHHFPQFQKWFMVHFMIHYVLFTFFEILFLLKIVNSKISNK